ncbi:MAG: 16S rRNA processing protein RimM, partial [Nitrospiraceae bacterium]|nr:16S rRNA processing protein RimM [Nitrospiraceae bacterium]
RCRLEQVRHHSGELIVRFSSGVTRETVAGMKGLSMVVDEETARPDEGAYHAADLEGFVVRANDGTRLGNVVCVYASGLSEAIEIEKTDGGTMLLPVIEQVIESVDLEQGVIVVGDVAPYVVEDAD